MASQFGLELVLTSEGSNAGAESSDSDSDYEQTLKVAQEARSRVEVVRYHLIRCLYTI